MTAPQRAHRIEIDAGADTAEDLAWELRQLATRLERGDLTRGCIGGPSSGSIYTYTHNPEMTHERYFAEIEAHLAAERKREA
jgi:hypothetical protein